MKIRLSKKFVVILGGGLVLCGASGAAAVLIGTDKILGPSYRDVNGLECTTLQTIKLRNDKSNWVRKYVTSDESADGPTRVRTALRVARAVQEKEKADLVQVAMIDKSGPKDRAEMRGRMIGAQVVYIPDLTKVPEGAAALSYSAYYVDGAPTSDGQFYGLRIDLPLEDIEHMQASLTDGADCINPADALVEAAHGAAAKGGHGEAKGEHGEAAGGHGAAKPSGHDEPAGHGDQAGTPSPADGHGEASGTEGHGALSEEGHGEEMAAKDGGGFLSSVTGMIFGGKDEPAGEQGGSHGSSSASGHGAVSGSGGHGSAGESGHSSSPNGEDHGSQQLAPAVAEGETEKKAPAAPEQEGFFEQVKGMIFGGGSGEAENAAHDEAKADARHPAEHGSDPAPEPRTSAEGGKRWSDASEKDEIRSEYPVHDAAATGTGGEENPGAGNNEADAAGAAWLAKLRGEAPGPDAQDAGNAGKH